jgi:hypothetical protein
MATHRHPNLQKRHKSLSPEVVLMSFEFLGDFHEKILKLKTYPPKVAVGLEKG